MRVIASLSLDDAAKRPWDAVVIGAGPAGALTARELARRQIAVLLVDKAAFPRWKVCGSCLNGRSLATLADVGLGGLVQRHGAVPLHRLHLAARQRTAQVHLPWSVALGRDTFDAALVNEAIQAGASFLPQTRATLEGMDGQRRLVSLYQHPSVGRVVAQVVVVANGLGGRLTLHETHRSPLVLHGSLIGAGVVAESAPAFYHPGTIFMACGDGGYVGLVRLEDGRLDIAAAFDPLLIKTSGGLGKAAVRVLNRTGWPRIDRLEDLAWRGTPELTRRTPCLAEDRLFVLGDAAGYVEPFTGEGIGWALASAAALAPLAVRAVHHWDPALGQRWRLLYRQIVSRRQRICRMIAGALRRPRLMETIVAVLARAPWLATPLVHRLNRSSRP